MTRIRNYYSGIGYYGLAYTLFVSLQFGIHDMLIESISEFTGSKQISIFQFLKIIEYNEPLDDHLIDSKSSGTHWHNELLSSFTAGCLSAFMTNGVETVAVNK